MDKRLMFVLIMLIVVAFLNMYNKDKPECKKINIGLIVGGAVVSFLVYNYYIMQPSHNENTIGGESLLATMGKDNFQHLKPNNNVQMNST